MKGSKWRVVYTLILGVCLSTQTFSQTLVSTTSCNCFDRVSDRLFADGGTYVYWQADNQLRRGTVGEDTIRVDEEFSINGFDSTDYLFAAEGNVVYWQSGDQVNRGIVNNSSLEVDEVFWFDGLVADVDRMFDAEGDMLYWQFGGTVVRGSVNNGTVTLDANFRFDGFDGNEDRLFAADGEYVYWQSDRTIRRGIVGNGSLNIDQDFLIESFRGTAFDAKGITISWMDGGTFHRGSEGFEVPPTTVDDPSDNIRATYSEVVNGTVHDSNGNPLSGQFDIMLEGVSDLPGEFILKSAEVSNGAITSIHSHDGLQFAGIPLIAGKKAEVSGSKIHIEGGIKLPLVPLPSGAFIYGIEENQFKIEQGTVRVPKVSIPKLFGMEGNLTVGQDFFDLNGRFGMRGLGGDPLKVGWIGGGATIRNNFIDRLALEGSSLNIPLYKSAVLLDAIDVEVSKITDPKNITLRGGVELIGGPKVLGISAMKSVVTGSITPFQGVFSLKGESFLFKFIKMSEQGVSVSLPDSNVHLYGQFVTPWLITGKGEIRFDNQGKSPVFYGSAEVSLEVVLDLPIVGEKRIRAAGVNLAISEQYLEGKVYGPTVPVPVWAFPPVQLKQSYAALRFTFAEGIIDPSFTVGLESHYEVWEKPHNQIYIVDSYSGEFIPVDMTSNPDGSSNVQALSTTEGPVLYATFMNNWILRDKFYLAEPSNSTPKSVRISQNNSNTVTIPENVRDGVVRITFENTGVNEVIADITSPDGDVYDQIIFEPQSQEANFWLVTPEAGEYTVTIANREVLGNTVVEFLQFDQSPVIEEIKISSTTNQNQYLVEWEDFDYESDAAIRFALSEDRDGNDGFYFAETSEDDETNSFLLNTQDESIDVPSGDYYVIMEIDDGVNAPEFLISDQRVRVINPEDPSPVYGISVDDGDNGFLVKWNKPDDDRVDGYTILYTPQDDLGHFDDHVAVTDPDVTSFHVTGVENGQPFLVTVVSVDEDGNRSIVSEVVRVIPQEADGTTSPNVISIPGQDAEVGSLYVYSPKFANCERFQIADYSFESTLVNAPSGMIVDDEGDIVWTPTAEQLGDHTIQIEHHFHFIQTGEIETETETFVIHVVEDDSLFGEETDTEILSTPDVSAYENTLYSYQIDVYDPDGVPTYELLQAPDGMTVDSNGLVTWDVQDFTTAYFPVRIVVKFTNGETEEQEFILDVVTVENSLETSSIQETMWDLFK